MPNKEAPVNWSPDIFCPDCESNWRQAECKLPLIKLCPIHAPAVKLAKLFMAISPIFRKYHHIEAHPDGCMCDLCIDGREIQLMECLLVAGSAV